MPSRQHLVWTVSKLKLIAQSRLLPRLFTHIVSGGSRLHEVALFTVHCRADNARWFCFTLDANTLVWPTNRGERLMSVLQCTLPLAMNDRRVRLS